MDMLQRAMELYAAGRMHDALEVAQAACDRAPKAPAAWLLLGRISRFTGMPQASDDAFRPAASLDASLALPCRVTAERFQVLVEEARRTLGSDPAVNDVRTASLPRPEQVRAGVDPDALTHREPAGGLVLFQVSHENRCDTED